jgi:hypothetical protein
MEDRSFCGYNEVVLSADIYAAALPHVIEAFFYPTNGVVHHCHCLQQGECVASSRSVDLWRPASQPAVCWLTRCYTVEPMGVRGLAIRRPLQRVTVIT